MKRSGQHNSRFFCPSTALSGLLLLLFLCGTASALNYDAGNEGHRLQRPWQIIFFNSYHQGYKWSDDVQKGIETFFASNDFKKRVNLIVEYMDTKRFANDEYMAQLYHTYRAKYKGVDVDLILSSDDNAFNFLKRYRSDLFGDTPYVFCGVNYVQPQQIRDMSNTAGVNEAAGIRETLALIFDLHPETEKIFVINDQTTTGQKVRQQILRERIFWEDQAVFEFSDDLSVAQILEKVRALDGNSVILYTFYFRDPVTNRFYEYDEVIELVRSVSNVPIYGTWDFNLGHGIVGGMLTSGYHQGKKAAELAGTVLSGSDINQIGVVMESPNRYFFDYDMVKKCAIALSQLPDGSIVINQPRTVFDIYEENKIFVLGSTSVFLASLVVILLIGGFKIRRANRTVRLSEQKYRTIFEHTGTAMIIVAADTTLKMVNSRFEQLFGYSRNEIEHKKSWFEFAHEADKELMQQYHQRRRVEEKQAPASYEFRFINRYQEERHIFITVAMVPGTTDSVGSLIDITDRKLDEKEKERLISELREALNSINTLQGLVPICSHCKNIRDDKGFWNKLEAYIQKHSAAEFSHSICPDCARKHYPDLDIYDENGECRTP